MPLNESSSTELPAGLRGGRYASNVRFFVGFRFLHFPLTKQFRFVQVKDVVGRHGKRAPRIVLHALVVGAVVQLMRHPALGFLQPHAGGMTKNKAESFGRRCDVGQHDAQLANRAGHVLAENSRGAGIWSTSYIDRPLGTASEFRRRPQETWHEG